VRDATLTVIDVSTNFPHPALKIGFWTIAPSPKHTFDSLRSQPSQPASQQRPSRQAGKQAGGSLSERLHSHRETGKRWITWTKRVKATISTFAHWQAIIPVSPRSVVCVWVVVSSNNMMRIRTFPVRVRCDY
jgi:hypothetical protein